jgi:hypothetical protein
MSEYGGEYVPPFVGVVLVFAWCRCIRGRVEVLAGVVVESDSPGNLVVIFGEIHCQISTGNRVFSTVREVVRG